VTASATHLLKEDGCHCQRKKAKRWEINMPACESQIGLLVQQLKVTKLAKVRWPPLLTNEQEELPLKPIYRGIIWRAK